MGREVVSQPFHCLLHRGWPGQCAAARPAWSPSAGPAEAVWSEDKASGTRESSTESPLLIPVCPLPPPAPAEGSPKLCVSAGAEGTFLELTYNTTAGSTCWLTKLRRHTGSHKNKAETTWFGPTAVNINLRLLSWRRGQVGRGIARSYTASEGFA